MKKRRLEQEFLHGKRASGFVAQSVAHNRLTSFFSFFPLNTGWCIVALHAIFSRSILG